MSQFVFKVATTRISQALVAVLCCAVLGGTLAVSVRGAG